MATCFERVQMIFGRILTGLGIGFITSGELRLRTLAFKLIQK